MNSAVEPVDGSRPVVFCGLHSMARALVNPSASQTPIHSEARAAHYTMMQGSHPTRIVVLSDVVHAASWHFRIVTAENVVSCGDDACIVREYDIVTKSSASTDVPNHGARLVWIESGASHRQSQSARRAPSAGTRHTTARFAASSGQSRQCWSRKRRM